MGNSAPLPHIKEQESSPFNHAPSDIGTQVQIIPLLLLAVCVHIVRRNARCNTSGLCEKLCRPCGALVPGRYHDCASWVGSVCKRSFYLPHLLSPHATICCVSPVNICTGVSPGPFGVNEQLNERLFYAAG